jgi:hypothetical protein
LPIGIIQYPNQAPNYGTLVVIGQTAKKYVYINAKSFQNYWSNVIYSFSEIARSVFYLRRTKMTYEKLGM